MVNQWWAKFTANNRLHHWFLLSHPSVWRAKTIAIIGCGAVGKNLLAKLEKRVQRLILVDSRADRYAFRIGHHDVVGVETFLGSKQSMASTDICVLTALNGLSDLHARFQQAGFETARLVHFPLNAVSHLQQQTVLLAANVPSGEKLEPVNANGLEQYQGGVVIVEHNLGGGTFQFSQELLTNMAAQQSTPITVLTFCEGRFHLVDWRTNTVIASLETQAELVARLSSLNPAQVVLSNVYSFADPLSILKAIRQLSVPIDIYIHDYYSLCQSYALLDQHGVYCDLPCAKNCAACIPRNDNIALKHHSIQDWREIWQDVLSTANRVITFSADSKRKLERVYGDGLNILVNPHSMAYFQPQYLYLKPRAVPNRTRIGILGPLTKKKGEAKVLRLADWINANRYPMSIVVFGTAAAELQHHSVIEVLGRYSPEELDNKVAAASVDIFLFPSLCPETFSYSVSEIISMEYPLVCFDLGAQADKVLQYERGLVVPQDIQPEQIVQSTHKLLKKVIEQDV